MKNKQIKKKQKPHELNVFVIEKSKYIKCDFGINTTTNKQKNVIISNSLLFLNGNLN